MTGEKVVTEEKAMLVLSRRVGQKVVIGNGVVVVVTAVNGDRVRLGFEGPGEVPIHREELASRLRAEELLECETREDATAVLA
jgi:carbon storage regulator